MDTKRLLAFWGKTFGQRDLPDHDDGAYKPVVHHLLDVAAVAQTFLKLNHARAEREAVSSGLGAADYGRLMAFYAGLHDLGKFTRNFQIKRPELWPEAALGLCPTSLTAGKPHWQATSDFLAYSTLAQRFGVYVAAGWEHGLIAAIAGHHGRPPPIEKNMDDRFVADLARGEWIDIVCVDAATSAFQLLEDIVRPPKIKVARVAPWSWRLSGLITLADWVGSDADFFGPLPLDMDLGEYWRLAQQSAARALLAKGLVAHAPLAAPNLADISTRAAASPRPMQELAQQAPITRGPQLFLIEDSTGSGKTEAALLLAARLVAQGQGEGLFIALPTMATANAMHDRLRPLASALFPDGRASLVLAHGKAVLTGALASHSLGDGEVAASEACNAWIADDRRRAFFADIGAGTIDQAFLAVLPKRYLTLRQYALAGRILIVDEAHCFDSYMKEELDALIRLHAMNGGSTIILSATLSLDARRKMATAFLVGLGSRRSDAEAAARACASLAYPLLTQLAPGVTQTPASLAPELARTVRIERLPDRAAAVEAAVAAAERGAAVLMVVNAVAEAHAMCRALGERRPGETLDLFHARFAQGDRLDVERRVLARFGRESAAAERAGRILVATQVVEQSLDVDFDLVITDLAPVDLLIQRAGRLWRHMDVRPASSRAIEGPAMLVVSPDPEIVAAPHWLADCLGGGSFVYQNAAVMWRSARATFGLGRIRTPDDLRPLVEAVYGDEDEIEPVPAILAQESLTGQGQETAAQFMGRFNVVKLGEGYGDLAVLGQDESVGTRLGEETMTLRLARRAGEKLVAWFQEEGLSPRVAWALSEVTLRRKLWSGATPLAADEALRLEARRDWSDWETGIVLVEVAENGRLLLEEPAFSYDVEMGLASVDRN